MKEFKFDLQRFKGNTTVENSYTPTQYEVALQKASSEYANAVMPNAYYLNDTARQLLENSLGTVQVDYNDLNRNAQNQISSSWQGLQDIIGSNNNSAANTNQALSDYTNGLFGSAQNANQALSDYGNGLMGSAQNTNQDLSRYGSGLMGSSRSANRAISNYGNNLIGDTADIRQLLSDYSGALNQFNAGINNDLQNISNATGANASATNSRLNGLEDIIRAATGYSTNQFQNTMSERNNATQAANDSQDTTKENFNNNLSALYKALTGNDTYGNSTPTDDKFCDKISL